jgi:hypothetical protein
MAYRVSAIVFRFVFAPLALGAVGYQLFAIHIPRGYNVVNFFMYVTNLSNILISVVFLVSAILLITDRTPRALDTGVRGAAVVYIAFVGLVFNTLLRDTDLSAINPAVNLILHTILPIVGVADWILWPPDKRLRFSAVW